MKLGNVFNCLGACSGRHPQTTTPTENGTTRNGPGIFNVDDQLLRDFEPVKTLGRGGVACTGLFRDKSRNEFVAIKLIPRPLAESLLKSILREIKIQTELAYGHVSIVDAYEAILLPRHVAIVMEFVAGGSLVQFLSERNIRASSTGLYMSEEEARYFFKQFIDVVGYCHAKSVVHRDLKLDNTMLCTNTPPRLKLIDFGFARTTRSEGYADTHVGTPVYMPPELLSNTDKAYNARAVDVYASGVLLCVMLLGLFPFDDQENSIPPVQSESERILWTQMMQRKWSERPQLINGLSKLSDDCKDLLDKMFVQDAKQRITIEGIKNHPWYVAPLLPKYQKEWDELQAEQAELKERRKSYKPDPAKLDARNKAIDTLVKMASQKPGSVRGDDYMRIDLRESAVASPNVRGS